MRVALIHFPKTGGTTLHDFIVTAFDKEKICPERLNEFDRFSDEDLQQYDYFSAHMDFRNLRRVARPAYTITVLREPKARLISLYYFWRAQSDALIEKHNLVGPRLAKRLSMLEFLNWQGDGIPSNINNFYTRYLIGMNTTGPNGLLALGDKEALRVATRNLLTIDEIGFLDQMPELMARVGARLRLEVPEEIPRARSAQNFGKDPNTEAVERVEITPEIDARLDELVRLDQVLYQNARRLFDVTGSD